MAATQTAKILCYKNDRCLAGMPSCTPRQIAVKARKGSKWPLLRFLFWSRINIYQAASLKIDICVCWDYIPRKGHIGLSSSDGKNPTNSVEVDRREQAVGFLRHGVDANGWLLKKLFTARKSEPTNHPVNINVSPTISPVFSNTQSTPSPETKPRIKEAIPNIKAVTYKADFVQGIGASGKSCFIISFRNDGRADATNVIAHIGYIGSSGQRFLVDYGAWVEHKPMMSITRGHTKNVIIALTENGENIAVTDIGPATDYTCCKLEKVGENHSWQMENGRDAEC